MEMPIGDEAEVMSQTRGFTEGGKAGGGRSEDEDVAVGVDVIL